MPRWNTRLRGLVQLPNLPMAPKGHNRWTNRNFCWFSGWTPKICWFFPSQLFGLHLYVFNFILFISKRVGQTTSQWISTFNRPNGSSAVVEQRYLSLGSRAAPNNVASWFRLWSLWAGRWGAWLLPASRSFLTCSCCRPWRRCWTWSTTLRCLLSSSSLAICSFFTAFFWARSSCSRRVHITVKPCRRTSLASKTKAFISHFSREPGSSFSRTPPHPQFTFDTYHWFKRCWN